MTRHPSVIAPADAPCPFCGSGGVALGQLARPTRKTKRERLKSYRPCDCAFCEQGRRLSAVPGHSAHAVAQLVANIDYQGGLCESAPTRDRTLGDGVAATSPAYQAHLDAGEVAVADVTAGGYRWEKAGTAA